MTENERIDLSSLDPARDTERWEAVVRGVVHRVVASRPLSVTQQLFSWRRPVFGIAAAAAAACVVAIVSAPLPARQALGESQSDPTATLARWAETEASPSTEDALRVLTAEQP